MGQIRIISDLHFGHTNMALKRGFLSVEEHDEYIIKMWNSVVKKKDTVIICGDITMEKANYQILDRLNGFKKIVLGNHDQPQHVPELLKHVNSVCGVMKFKGFWISHIPIHPTELRGLKNIHGHCHENSLVDDRYINVSWEILGGVPVLLDSLK